MTLIRKQGLASMRDGVQISWTALGDTAAGTTRRAPVVMLHGGPGVRGYLGDVAPMLANLAPVFYYEQRGTGGCPW